MARWEAVGAQTQWAIKRSTACASSGLLNGAGAIIDVESKLAEIERHWDGVDAPRTAERDDILWLVREVRARDAWLKASDPSLSLPQPLRMIYVLGGTVSVLAALLAGACLAVGGMVFFFVEASRFATAFGIPEVLG